MQLDVSEMSEASDPTRGVAVQLPINLFGAFKSYRFRKFEPPYLGKELARLADARVYYRENKKDDVSGRSEDQRGMNFALIKCNTHIRCRATYWHRY